RNLGKFSSLTAKDIMTPRTVIVGFCEDETVEKVMEELREKEFDQRFSRIPVYQNGIDEISGFIHKHDLLLNYAHDEGEVQLKDFKRPIMVMPMVAKISTLLERMLAKKEHMVLLVDEYGGTAGIATLEDIVETL